MLTRFSRSDWWILNKDYQEREKVIKVTNQPLNIAGDAVPFLSCLLVQNGYRGVASVVGGHVEPQAWPAGGGRFGASVHTTCKLLASLVRGAHGGLSPVDAGIGRAATRGPRCGKPWRLSWGGEGKKRRHVRNRVARLDPSPTVILKIKLVSGRGAFGETELAAAFESHRTRGEGRPD